MNPRLAISTCLIIAAVAFVFPSGSMAKPNGRCTIKAVKDVYLEVYYSRGGRKAPTIRRKNEVMWSGTLPRGGTVPVSAPSGWVHLTFEDLTVEDPRTENDDTMCQGNTILVPR